MRSVPGRDEAAEPSELPAPRRPATPPAGTAALRAEQLRGFYRDLVLIRRYDAEATALQRQGELGLWASLLGLEAAQVGSGRAMRP